MFQSVVLKRAVQGDLDKALIPAGTFGALIEIFDGGQVIVELFDDEGWTIDIATIPASYVRASTEAELEELRNRPLPDISEFVKLNE